MTTIPTIRVYMACLASYNNGILHGRWIDATQGIEHLQNELALMLSSSPIPHAEEHALHDYEGFENLPLSEWESLEHIVELADFIETHGALGAALIGHYGDIEHARCALTEYYIGHYDRAADYAQELTEDIITIPDSLAYYIDYEAMARDLAINDLLVIETVGAGVHLFWQH